MSFSEAGVAADVILIKLGLWITGIGLESVEKCCRTGREGNKGGTNNAYFAAFGGEQPNVSENTGPK